MRGTGRDTWVQIRHGDLSVTLCSEGVSHSPDVAADLVTRALAGFREAFELLVEDDYEDDEAEPADDDATTD